MSANPPPSGDQARYERYAVDSRTVDMTAVFDALQTLRRCAAICSQARVAFRCSLVGPFAQRIGAGLSNASAPQSLLRHSSVPQHRECRDNRCQR
jgi:hypothetical protein